MNPNNQTSQVTPDQGTAERIKNLAYVGKALYEITSEAGYQTDYFVAKEALNKFKDGILKLNLDAESMEGMMSLVKYLNKKIDKRMNASVKGTQLD